MGDLGKLLMVMGGLLFIIGLIAMILPSSLPKLPGDIYIRRQNFVFYFPIVTSILISVILTLLFYLFSRR